MNLSTAVTNFAKANGRQDTSNDDTTGEWTFTDEGLSNFAKAIILECAKIANGDGSNLEAEISFYIKGLLKDED